MRYPRYPTSLPYLLPTLHPYSRERTRSYRNLPKDDSAAAIQPCCGRIAGAAPRAMSTGGRVAPTLHALYRSQRLRASRDLLTRIPKLPSAVPHIIDVGCGVGDATKTLIEKFPSCKLLLLDTSEERLEAAKEDEVLSSRTNLSFTCEDVNDHFAPEKAATGAHYDLIFSNAALHWSDNVPTLLSNLLNRVRPGGSLALQIPDMGEQPTHSLFVETAVEMHLSLDSIRFPTNTADPSKYAETLLDKRCEVLDMWSTTYVHCLEGEDAVFNFIRTTYDGRTALPSSLGGEGEEAAKEFEDAYRQKIARAYPPSANGTTLFPFTRFFLVATRPDILSAFMRR